MDIRNFFSAKSVKKANEKKVEKETVKEKEVSPKKPVKEEISKKTPKSPHQSQKKDSGRKNNKTKPQKKSESKCIIFEEDNSDKQQAKDKNGNKKSLKNDSKRNRKKSDSDSESEGKKKKIVIDSDSDSECMTSIKDVSKAKKSRKSNGETEKAETTKRKRVLMSSDEEPEKVAPPKQRRKSRKIDSDSDNETNTSSRKRKTSGRKSHYFNSDSDEEKHRKSTLDAFFKSPVKSSKVQESNKEKKSERKQVIDVHDFFGGGSVKRSDNKMVATKSKTKDLNSENSPILLDVEMHEDESFVEMLDKADKEKCELSKENDNSKHQSSKVKTNGDSSPVKIEQKSLSSSDKPSPNKGRSATESSPNKTTSIHSDKPSPIKGQEKSSPQKSRTKVTPSPIKDQEKCSPQKSPGKHRQSPNKAKNDKSPTKSKVEITANSSSAKAGNGEKKTKTEALKQSPETPVLVKKTSYRNYLQREGPQALGSKEIPEGGENCLESLTFVITGVLESMERDDAKKLIEKYGGKVTGNVSKRTNYLVTGRDSGASKLEKANSLGVKQIDEDGLLNLLRTLPGKRSKYEVKAEEQVKKEASLSEKLTSKAPLKKQLSEFEREPPSLKVENADETLMFVDKYKPTQLKQIIGQGGDKSNAKKLFHWLTNWHKSRAAGIKPTGKFFNKNDDGSGFKAALLSGPPGIGKTTTATLVCKETGFSFVELNASDTRSKKSLKEVVSESLSNTTMVDYIESGHSATQGHKHCLIMDEVDGMAGNEDRGGLQELVNLIKSSHIPIICMCNDRNHQKMRTLSNYCFDLRFQKPRLEQIKGAMMSIAYKEGLKIPAPALNEIILAANQDIRQVLHNLSMWTAGEKSITYEQAKRDSNSAKKDFKLGPFDVCRKVFVGGDETAGMTINDKSDLYFHDYSIAPLFVQENYINVIPYAARGNGTRHLSLLARTADSLCEGDRVDRAIRQNQSWSLLPTAAMYASVIPGEFMRGNFPQMVSFPSWLGKNSTTTKMDRIIQELRSHTALKISGNHVSLNTDYLPFMRSFLTQPLVSKEDAGITEVIDMMENYDIVKDDFDNILEITKWPNSSDPMSSLSSKTKAAFTRTYNKEVHLTPYALGTLTKKGKGVKEALVEEGEEMEVESEEEEGGVETDSMIKQSKKPKAQDKGKATKEPTSKGKGKGKSSAKGKK